MTDQRPCSCGGSNENCARCYGRGFTEGGYVLARRRGKARKKSKIIVQRRVPDLSTNHVPESMSPLRSGSATGRPMKSCPLCQVQVREDRLPRHITERCPSRIMAEISATTPSRPALNSRLSSRRKSTISLRDIELFVKCPTCGAKVASDQFTQHRAVAHGRTGESRGEFQTPVARNQARSGEPGAVKRSKNRKANVNRVHSMRDNAEPESARQKDKMEVERPSWWDNLDATKNCGYPAREEGRYGSYPSHDGFDDESKP